MSTQPGISHLSRTRHVILGALIVGAVASAAVGQQSEDRGAPGTTSTGKSLLHRKAKGSLIGRVMTEAMPNGVTPKGFSGTVTGKPAANGLRTVLQFQRVLNQRYFDVAGFPGRTVGLPETVKTAGAK